MNAGLGAGEGHGGLLWEWELGRGESDGWMARETLTFHRSPGPAKGFPGCTVIACAVQGPRGSSVGTQVPGQALGEMALAYGKGHCCWVSRPWGDMLQGQVEQDDSEKWKSQGKSSLPFPRRLV